jgi:hypothetical protein
MFPGMLAYFQRASVAPQGQQARLITGFIAANFALSIFVSRAAVKDSE